MPLSGLIKYLENIRGARASLHGRHLTALELPRLVSSSYEEKNTEHRGETIALGKLIGGSTGITRRFAVNRRDVGQVQRWCDADAKFAARRENASSKLSSNEEADVASR